MILRSEECIISLYLVTPAALIHDVERMTQTLGNGIERASPTYPYL